MRTLLLGMVIASLASLASPTPLPQLILRGDVNQDESITAADALGVLSSVVGHSLPEGWIALPNGDVNCSGSLSALDALIVMGHVVGKDVSQFCIGGSLVADALIAEAIASMEEAMFTGLNADSVAQLDEFSFAESNALFLEALTTSPSNDTASFGTAVTGIFLLEDNPDVRALVDDWDAWLDEDTIQGSIASLLGPAIAAIRDPLTLPLGFSTETMEQVAYSGTVALELASGPARVQHAPPSLERHQTVLREVVRPALIAAVGHLFEITNSGFTFTVTEAMQGESPIDADPLELDYTEILAMQAGLKAALAAVDVATAYILTPDPLDAQGFVDAMTPGSTFLTLATGGADDLGNALERLRSAGTILLSGLDALEAETDDQTDDIIKIGLDDLSEQDIADARALIQDILDALSSPTVITVDEGGLDEFSFTLDARKFFIDPIADFKAMLAPYEVFTAVEDGETVPFSSAGHS